MILSTISFQGYRRLLDTQCNVDGPALAFIGPNESGKSSVLQGLEWLTDDTDEELELRDLNRLSHAESSAVIVRAIFRIEQSDIDHLKSLPIYPAPELSLHTLTHFRYSKRKDGSVVTGVSGKFSRNRVPFDKASSVVGRLKIRFEEIKNDLEDIVDGNQFKLALEAFVPFEAEKLNLTSDEISEFSEGISVLEDAQSKLEGIEMPSTKIKAFCRELTKALPIISTAVEHSKAPDPEQSIRSELRKKVPKFILFGDDDREISRSYLLRDPKLRDDPPAPLANLLRVGKTSVDELWNLVEMRDTTRLRSREREINYHLRERISPHWSQSSLTVKLAVNSTGDLEVNIEELASPFGGVTQIEERSDGLRSFLGLLCFLLAKELAVPPVLMIDEAERNLHYDAQADLVRVLTNELNVHKVIYTTHSPGCLPLDLGTGIRVVARSTDQPEVSVLKNNFWTDSEPGFSHLLFAMGAQASTFSAFRKAVLAEGISEMILLPTLLRNATGGKKLDFQVAPGLSNLEATKAMGNVALLTNFLVDGDEAGDLRKLKLIEAGVPSDRIFQLPANHAIEDLVDRRVYLDAVNAFLVEQGNLEIDETALIAGTTIARSVDLYAKNQLGISSGISHKIIASRLANQRENLKLSPAGRRFLKLLRPKLELAFNTPYTINTVD